MTSFGEPIEGGKQSGKSLKMAQERVGEPIEAVCSVSEGTFTRNFLRALFTGRPTRLATLVLTPTKLYLLEPKFSGLGKERTCLEYCDIAQVQSREALLGITCRLTHTDGSRLDFKILRRQRGDEIVERLTKLTATRTNAQPSDGTDKSQTDETNS